MGKALWRRAFDAADGALGPRVQQLVREGSFATSVVMAQRTSRFITSLVEQQSRRTWHALNLPAGSDVQRLRRQIGDLDREVRLVRDALERQPRGAQHTAPSPSPRRTHKAGS